jgi:hypothetical protein
MNFTTRTLLALIFAAALGCARENAKSPIPTTYPVSGQVVFRNGKPFPGGMIHFVSKAEPSLAISGTIEDDGSFEVFTIFGGKPLPGAVRGLCTVMVSPPINENKPVDIYQPKKEFEVKERENHFVVELDAKR